MKEKIKNTRKKRAHQIKSLVREVAEKRGIENAYQLRLALDVSPPVATRLWEGDFDKLGMNTLSTLCRVLKVQPGSLLRYEAEDE